MATHPRRTRRLILITLFLSSCVAATACTLSSNATPEGAAEGALRAAAQELVAPTDYRSGRLTPEQAQQWLERVRLSLEPYYSPDLVGRHMRGVTNVVEDHVQHIGPIVTSVQVTSVSLGPAETDGSDTRFSSATVDYRTQLGEDVPAANPEGGKMCILLLRRTEDGDWQVVDETCNESG